MQTGLQTAGEVERFLSRWEDAFRSLQDGAFAAEQGNGPAVEQAATRFEQGIAGGAEIAPTSGRRTAPPWLSPAAPQR
jgi:hypothetical protein